MPPRGRRKWYSAQPNASIQFSALWAQFEFSPSGEASRIERVDGWDRVGSSWVRFRSWRSISCLCSSWGHWRDRRGLLGLGVLFTQIIISGICGFRITVEWEESWVRKREGRRVYTRCAPIPRDEPFPYIFCAWDKCRLQRLAEGREWFWGFDPIRCHVGVAVGEVCVCHCYLYFFYFLSFEKSSAWFVRESNEMVRYVLDASAGPHALLWAEVLGQQDPPAHPSFTSMCNKTRLLISAKYHFLVCYLGKRVGWSYINYHMLLTSFLGPQKFKCCVWLALRIRALLTRGTRGKLPSSFIYEREGFVQSYFISFWHFAMRLVICNWFLYFFSLVVLVLRLILYCILFLALLSSCPSSSRSRIYFGPFISSFFSSVYFSFLKA